MSTKVKRKSEKAKTKKLKKPPLKISYNEEEIVELKHKYEDILFHLSIFYQIIMFMRQSQKMLKF